MCKVASPACGEGVASTRAGVLRWQVGMLPSRVGVVHSWLSGTRSRARASRQAVHVCGHAWGECVQRGGRPVSAARSCKGHGLAVGRGLGVGTPALDHLLCHSFLCLYCFYCSVCVVLTYSWKHAPTKSGKWIVLKGPIVSMYSRKLSCPVI